MAVKRIHLPSEIWKAQLEVYQRIADSRSWDKPLVDALLLSNPDAFRQVMTEHIKTGQRELAGSMKMKREIGLSVSGTALAFSDRPQ